MDLLDWGPLGSGPWPMLALAGAYSSLTAQTPSGEWTWGLFEGAPRRVPKLCPHRGMPMSGCKISSGKAVCPYHGRRIAPADEPMFRALGMDWAGAHNPALEYLVHQQNSSPWLATVAILEAGAEAPLSLCHENFLDATHTPHVHPGLIRSEKSPKPIDARGISHPWGFEIEYREEGAQSGWIGRIAEPRRLRAIGRYLHPFASQVDYEGLDGRSYFRATAYMLPGSESTRCRVVVQSGLLRMGAGPLFFLRPAIKRLFQIALNQDATALRKAWSGIRQMGLAMEEVPSEPSDLAWPWIRAWCLDNPPKPGETFARRIMA